MVDLEKKRGAAACFLPGLCRDFEIACEPPDLESAGWVWLVSEAVYAPAPAPRESEWASGRVRVSRIVKW